MNEIKKTNQERLKEITESIETGIQNLFESDQYRNYLRTMSRFHNYSVNNTVLIYLQKPDATLVAGFSRWKNQFQRTVNKGEHGIRIIAPTPYRKTVAKEKTDPDTGEILFGRDGQPLKENVQITVPMFKPVTVFDISQTSGKPIPQLVATLTGDVENYEIFMEALRRSAPVPITIRPIQSNADGFFSPKDQSITIRDDMSQIQTVCATVHEIAHSKLHNYTKAKADGAEVVPKDQRTEEVEAESIAFTVCAYYGIETSDNSLGYIAGWSKDKTLPELRSSLETITETASELITDIDRNFAEIRKERGMDLENMEALYLLDDKLCLHLQATDSNALDYTLYDSKTMREIDGGQIDLDNPFDFSNGIQAVCELHELDPRKIEEIPLSSLEKYENANAIGASAHISQQELAMDIPMPDSRFTMEDLKQFGYMDESMLPLSKSRAMELYENNAPVYLLFDNNTKSIAMAETDIALHTGMFGISTEEWTNIHASEQHNVELAEKEQAFMQSPSAQYAIYQLKSDPAFDELRFMGSDWISRNGMDVDRNNYELVYVGNLPQGQTRDAQLESVYETLNMHRPADYTGHSLSVSDVVAIKSDTGLSCHYCDNVGFRELPSFLQSENYLKNAEISLEDDYGMIDGILNNGTKEEPVKREKPKPKTKQPEKKPSVLQKLRTIKPKETLSADGQERSIEYEYLDL